MQVLRAETFHSQRVSLSRNGATMPQPPPALQRLGTTGRLLTALLALAFLVPATFAQEGAQVGGGEPASVADPSPIATPIEVSDEEAAQHLTRRVTPRYPPLA